jgi:hypothetical protein
MSQKMQMIPADTSAEAARVYFKVLRKIGGARRLEMGFELSHNLRSVTEAGVRLRHPEYDTDEVRLAVVRLMVGDELFRQCCPKSNVEP